MAYIGKRPEDTFRGLASKASFTGDGSTVTFDLSENALDGGTNDIQVFVNNVRQEPAVAYNVSGTALTLTGNVASTDDFYVVYQGKAVQTTTPPAGSAASPTTVGSFLGDAGTALGNIIRVHEKELNTSVTIASNTNGLCAGPLNLATGVTVTVSNGATLVVA